MKKDFDKWNVDKKLTQEEKPRLYTVREIWWCKLGVNVGFEQDGGGQLFLRPVIIRSFGPGTCVVVPLTTSERKHPLRMQLGTVQGKSASATLSQLRVIDTRRLVEKIEFLNKNTFNVLRKAVRNLF